MKCSSPQISQVDVLEILSPPGQTQAAAQTDVVFEVEFSGSEEEEQLVREALANPLSGPNPAGFYESQKLSSDRPDEYLESVGGPASMRE